MARGTRSAQLETRTARLKLPIAKKPVFVRVGPKVGLGYRRNKTAGAWVARVADGKGGNWTKAIGLADDFQDANNSDILDFWQAQQKAHAIARGDRGDAARPITVREALDEYEGDLRRRGADTANVLRVRARLPKSLADKAVALLSARDLRRWRDGLTDKMAASSANRTCTALRAALNLAADHDDRIANRQAWGTGLAAIPDAEQSRNVILDEAAVRRIVAEAHAHNAEFGIMVELAAVTGARVSQLARIEVQDLQADRSAPRVLMPTSRKGKGTKKISRGPVPIPVGLATKLVALTVGRSTMAPLLLKRDGQPWQKSDQRYLFRRVAIAAEQDPAEVTIYALRHSNIVRQLLAGVPIRVVAVNHDTSVTMIERTYSRHIGDHADQVARGALLDLDTSLPSAAANVVPLRSAAPIE